MKKKKYEKNCTYCDAYCNAPYEYPSDGDCAIGGNVNNCNWHGNKIKALLKTINKEKELC